jgi:hypothetical protein
MCIETIGFIPFIPCKPAPISAYTVLRAVCILSGTTSFTPNFEEVSLLTKIKWEGQISRGFEEKQGVRQGGVWSPTAYKVFKSSYRWRFSFRESFL